MRKTERQRIRILRFFWKRGSYRCILYSSKLHFWNDMDGYFQELVGEESPDTRSISRLLGFFHMLGKSVLISAIHLHGKSGHKTCTSRRGVRSK